MKKRYWVLTIILVIILGFLGILTYRGHVESERLINPMTHSQVIPIEHASGIIQWGETAIYFDPTGGEDAYKGMPPADIVLVTDIHEDHFSIETLNAVVGENTLMIVPQVVKDKLPAALAAKARVLRNGQGIDLAGTEITAVPMYNLPDAENANFHTKGRGNGYVVDQEGLRAYIAGDTAGTPEMRALERIDIAFIPMNLPYTMSVEDAADAVLAFKPKVVYPYHYRGQDGLADVNKFKELVDDGGEDIEVILANWYPER